MPITSPYCLDTELLLEDAVRMIPAGLSKASYISAASREIDAKLGMRYRIPLAVDPNFKDQYGNPVSDFPDNEKAMVRDICVKLASGRILLQIASDADDNFSKYGWELIKEAQYFLTMLASGDVRLSAAPAVGAETDLGGGPSITNRDHASMVEGFEDIFMRPPPVAPPLVPPAVYPGPE